MIGMIGRYWWQRLLAAYKVGGRCDDDELANQSEAAIKEQDGKTPSGSACAQQSENGKTKAYLLQEIKRLKERHGHNHYLRETVLHTVIGDNCQVVEIAVTALPH